MNDRVKAGLVCCDNPAPEVDVRTGTLYCQTCDRDLVPALPDAPPALDTEQLANDLDAALWKIADHDWSSARHLIRGVISALGFDPDALAEANDPDLFADTDDGTVPA